MALVKDYIATRVAYLMDFTGPAMNVNSACSSALVAVVQALLPLLANVGQVTLFRSHWAADRFPTT